MVSRNPPTSQRPTGRPAKPNTRCYVSARHSCRFRANGVGNLEEPLFPFDNAAPKTSQRRATGMGISRAPARGRISIPDREVKGQMHRLLRWRLNLALPTVNREGFTVESGADHRPACTCGTCLRHRGFAQGKTWRFAVPVAPWGTTMFKLALAQMLVEGGRKEANVRRALDRVRHAASKGARVIVLPEALTVGWTHASSRSEAEPIPDGPSCEALRRAARECGMHVCAGLVEEAGGAIFNAAVLIDPNGEVILHHRKLNELEIAHDCYAQGDRLAVAQTTLGTIGVMICADAFARGQIVSRVLALMGAQIILSPCAWAVPATHDNATEPYGQLWLDNYCPVARDFGLWIAGASNVGWITEGPWKGRKCIGCSLVIDPDGHPALQGPCGDDADTILYVDVDLRPRPARGDGWERFLASRRGS
jgi:predicted amidohydrolase